MISILIIVRLFSRDDVEWSEEQSEEANAIIEKQFEQRMSDTKWGLLSRSD